MDIEKLSSNEIKIKKLQKTVDKKTKMELTVILEKEDEKRVNLLDSKNLIQFVF